MCIVCFPAIWASALFVPFTMSYHGMQGVTIDKARLGHLARRCADTVRVHGAAPSGV